MRQTAAQDFSHHTHIVWCGRRAHGEALIVGFFRFAVFKDHHRARRRRALDVGNVKALDAQGQVGKFEFFFQLKQRAGQYGLLAT